ncbi:hypothetical protein BDZ45DRAFT_722570 [Acephala macrosclerotiorum]|nr:hypothetical protein BDZ45DRAFT_722570 [Acephala macrosclerotiorum]
MSSRDVNTSGGKGERRDVGNEVMSIQAQRFKLLVDAITAEVENWDFRKFAYKYPDFQKRFEPRYLRKVFSYGAYESYREHREALAQARAPKGPAPGARAVTRPTPTHIVEFVPRQTWMPMNPPSNGTLSFTKLATDPELWQMTASGFAQGESVPPPQMTFQPSEKIRQYQRAAMSNTDGYRTRNENLECTFANNLRGAERGLLDRRYYSLKD